MIGWLGLHLITLMGVRNRLNVFINWVWNYLTYDRSVRIILEHQPHGTFASDAAGSPSDDADGLESEPEQDWVIDAASR